MWHRPLTPSLAALAAQVLIGAHRVALRSYAAHQKRTLALYSRREVWNSLGYSATHRALLSHTYE